MSNEFVEKYELLQTLGTGAFSEVRVGVHKGTGHQFAIKIIDRAKCKGKESMIETEVNILKRVKHENIIQLYEMFEIGNKIYLVMELVTGGELFDEIVGRGKYTERDAAKIVHKILCAIDYLHSIGIVHRDLKPENLLLSDKSKNPKIMISDFGLSKIFNDTEVMKTACGTPGYVAPEVLKRQGYGREVDLWSFGVITYILLCGYPPFYDPSNIELFKKIMAGKYEFDRPWWDNVSEKAKDFIRHLLVLDPNHRFTAADALAHPFIVDHCGTTSSLSESLTGSVKNSTPLIHAPVPIHPPQYPNLGPAIHTNMPRVHSIKHNGPARPSAPAPIQEPRPIGNKKQIDDSGIVTSHEGLAQRPATTQEQHYTHQRKPKEKGIFGNKMERLTSWFKLATVSKSQRGFKHEKP